MIKIMHYHWNITT